MHVHWSYRTPVVNFISYCCQHVNVLKFLRIGLSVLSLNLVVLSGYLWMCKHVNTREEICT
jgi:hypothetical protein